MICPRQQLWDLDLNSVVYLKALYLSWMKCPVKFKLIFFFFNTQGWESILDTIMRPILWILGKWLSNTAVNREETRSFIAYNSFTFCESQVLYGRLIRAIPQSSSNTSRIQASRNSRAWRMHILKHVKHFSWRIQLIVGGSDNPRHYFSFLYKSKSSRLSIILIHYVKFCRSQI